MNLTKAIKILEKMNLWRQSLPPYDSIEVSMPYSPHEFSEAIDIAIKKLKKTNHYDRYNITNKDSNKG